MTDYGTVTSCADGASVRPATRDEWLASVRAAAAGPMPGGWSIIPTWHERDAGLMVYVQGGPEDDDSGSAGVILTRDQLEAWAGRTLTDDEIEQIDECIPNSSIPEAISEIAAQFEDDADE